MNEPTIEELKALGGKIFSMLTSRETDVFDFHRKQGRKFGASISIINEADREELARATSTEAAD